MYPCSPVCRSSMKLASARSNRAPKAQYTAKRAPVSFAARSRSRIPRCSPSSQCGLALKSNCGGEPQRRASTLSASLFPIGTPSCGRFGIEVKISRSRASCSAAFFSDSAICSRSSLVSAICAVASCPLFFNFAISSEARLRRACKDSAAVMACRRSPSIVRKSFNTSAGFIPRCRSFSSTSARLSRTKFRSSILHLL